MGDWLSVHFGQQIPVVDRAGTAAIAAAAAIN
jgi:hypothetical protein